VNSHFGDSRVEGPKTLHQDWRNREVQSPEGAKRFVWGQLLVKCVGTQHFGISEDKNSGFRFRDFRNCRTQYRCGRGCNKRFGTSEVQVSEGEELRDLEGEVAKSRTLKSRNAKKYDHIVWSEGDWN
jgi:hypothetical protein